MNGFLKWFFAFMSEMLKGYASIIRGFGSGLKQIFNIKNYINIFKEYSQDYSALSWVLSIIAIILVVAIYALILFMIVLAVRKYIRFRHSIVSNEDLLEEISDLQRKVMKMAKEKDEIMAMKVSQMGLPAGAAGLSLADGSASALTDGEANGEFAHNPEPLRQHLGEICDLMAKGGYDLGCVCDPDVDRLAFIQEDGEMYGEEYTLVTCADWVLQHTPGNTVSNLSSTRALRDVTEKYGCQYNASAVGEVNVVTLMKKTNAVIGGEGNGGVIYPTAHPGRDALVGIAIMLTYMAKTGKKPSELRKLYPPYFIAKNRIDLQKGTDVDAILAKVKEMYKDERVTDIDGVKIDFADEWVHLRKSNTEPIIRVYSEAHTMEAADALGKKIMDVVYSMI